MEDNNNNSGLFRKSSLDSISGPEQMNDYIRVIGPSIWLVLIAVIVMLLGIIVWGVFGRLQTSAESVAFVEDKLAVCYVSKTIADEVDKEDDMLIGGQAAKIDSVSSVPVQASGVYDERTLEDLGMSGFEMIYAITATTDVPDGSYKAELIVEKIQPLSFITGDDR
ncbi:MAG: hypothetical protein J5966_05415 [Lachnospiraceae bacterium]|nr:hypothetical protein [Lachnospiraceae bacterium]